MHILTTAAASFFAWTALRYLLPVVLPERLAILGLGAVTYGIWQLPRADITGILAASGAALLLVVGFSAFGDLPAPWDWHLLRIPRHRRRQQAASGTPASGIGSRIPRLR